MFLIIISLEMSANNWTYSYLRFVYRKLLSYETDVFMAAKKNYLNFPALILHGEWFRLAKTVFFIIGGNLDSIGCYK